MWKKNISLWFLFCMLSSMTGRAADFMSGKYGCNATSAHTATIVSVDSIGAELVFPETVEYRGRTLRVTAIDGDIISDKEKALSVSLPSTLVRLGISVFKDCIGLRSITLPASLQEIGSNCFSGCENLVALVLPEQLRTIYDDAFRNCRKAFSDVVLGEVDLIGSSAFRGCTSLRSIEISSLRDLGSWAFAECEELVSCKLPVSYGYMYGVGVFMGCTKLQEIVVPLFMVDFPQSEDMFAGCTSLSSVQLPPSMRSVGERMFANCQHLTSISIPQDVTRIYNAFEGCGQLQEIDVMAEEPPYLSEDAFSNEQCENLLVCVPVGCKQRYEENEFWKKMKHIEEKESFNHQIVVWLQSYKGTLAVDGIPPVAIEDDSDPNLKFFVSTISNGQDYVVKLMPDPYHELDRLFLNDVLVTDQVVDNQFNLHTQGEKYLGFSAYFKQRMSEIEIVQSELGSVKFQLPQGKPYTYSIVPDSGWVVHSVTYNDMDITNRVRNGETVDTPVLEEDAVVHIAFMTVADGVSVADKEQMHVLVYNGNVQITQAKPNELIRVYSIDGKTVETRKADSNGFVTFPLEKGKVYLVKTKTRTIKFAM